MEYTTIRLEKNVKKMLDSITPRNMSYSKRISMLYYEAMANDSIKTIVDSIENSSDWITLDELEKKIEQ